MIYKQKNEKIIRSSRRNVKIYREIDLNNYEHFQLLMTSNFTFK